MPPVAAAVAGFVTALAVDIGVSAGVAAFVGNGILALGGAMGLGAAVGAWAVVGGIANAAGLFGHPSLGAAGTTHNPIEFKADPQAGIPYVIGRTGTAGNIVYIDHSGGEGGSVLPGEPDLPPNRFIHFFTVYGGGGPYHALESFKADDITVTFDSDGATSTSPYAGNMWLRYQLGHQPETAMTQAPEVASASFGAGALPSWTSNHKLNGKAASWWTLQADQDAYPSGQPKPLAVWQGALVWDPRLDSTWPGGSGSCRLDDPSTWVYSETPQLHALKWCLGVEENGKRVLGIGAPLAAIDVAAFVDGANVAEANGWKAGGTVYSTDSKYAVLVAMLQAGGAIPVPLGAQISCVTQQPRVSIRTVTAQDMAAPPSIARTQDRKTRINQVIPTYRDETFSWQQVEADPVSVSAYITADGELRSRASTYALVQDVDQAAQLARYEIEDSREGAPIVLPMYTYTLGLKPGDCITADDEELALAGQKLLILKRELDAATGMITFTCRTETDAKHAAALGTTGVAPPPSDQSASKGKYDGETPPPGVQIGGHGPLVFTENADRHGNPADGKIRIQGRRINTAGGRLQITLKEIDTPLKTGGLKGVFWLMIGATDAADRFPGWASPTDGLFFARYFGSGRWKAYDSAGTAYNFTPAKTDAILYRTVRRNGSSTGIERLEPLFTYSRGLGPDFAPELAAPAAEDITAEGLVKQAKDGTVKPKLRVASNVVRTDADLWVRWRPAAGAYPGAIFAADFLTGTYQLDPDAVDPQTTWLRAPSPIKGSKPTATFGGFDGGEVLDVGAQWRETDDAGLISAETVIAGVAIPEKTTAPGPITGASVTLKRGVPRVKWTNPTDTDFKRTNWRRGTTTVFADATAIKTPGAAEHFDDTEAAAGTPVYYFATTENRSGVEDLGAYVMVGPVTPTAIKNADIGAGEVNSTSLATGAVTASRATPRSEDVTDRYFQDSAYWLLTGGAAIVTGTTETTDLGVPAAALFSATSISGQYQIATADAGSLAPVKPGSTLRVRARSRLDATFNGHLYVQINFYKQDGTASAITPTAVVADVDYTAVAPGSTTKNPIEGQVDVPSDAVFRKALAVCDWSAGYGSGRAGNGWLSDITVRQLHDRLPAGAAVQLSSGAPSPVAPRPFRLQVVDGQVVTFDYDLGDIPDVDFINLPVFAYPTRPRALPAGLTSQGFTAAIKSVTPGTTVAHSTGAGAVDTSLPNVGLGSSTGLSVSKGAGTGDGSDPFDGNFALNVTWSMPKGNKNQTITGRLFYKDGGAWTRISDFVIVNSLGTAQSGVAQTITFSASGPGGASLSSSAKIGLVVMSQSAGVGTIDSISTLKWWSRTDSSVVSISDPVTAIIWPKNNSAGA